MTAPSIEGISTGTPTYRQNCHCDAPRLADASRHSLRNPSMAGAITRIMSGSWK